MNITERNATLDMLVELHNSVKDHPYRIEDRKIYLNNYHDILRSMGKCFYWVIKETKYKNSYYMLHDFNCSVRNIGRENYDKHMHETILHIEYCIGVIHEFIDTEKVPKYYTLYFNHTIKSFPNLKEYIFNNDTGKYTLNLTKVQLNNVLEEIKSHYKTFPPKEWEKNNWFSEEKYNYFLKLKK